MRLAVVRHDIGGELFHLAFDFIQWQIPLVRLPNKPLWISRFDKQIHFSSDVVAVADQTKMFLFESLNPVLVVARI